MVQKASNKEVGFILDTAEAGGWTIRTKKNGWMLLSPDKQKAVMVHATNSDYRALKNIRSTLRSAGLKI